MNKARQKELIIMQVTDFSKNQLFLNKEIPLKFQKQIDEKISRLETGEPIEYIINNAEFYGLDFYVDSRVLIPRNDSEVMVEQVVKSEKWKMKSDKEKIILIDVWTGSSCIAISVFKSISNIDKCYAIDISKEALEVAKINIEKYWLQGDIILMEWNLLDNFSFFPLSSWSLIITANLPYIKNWDFENMSAETIKYEPDLALYWWKKTGFELYERLINQCLELKNTWFNIVLFIEIGFDQKQIASDFLANLNLKFEIFKDNGAIDRCVKIYFD